MLLGARQNLLNNGMNFIPIEYLEGTGTQWIDTGIYGGFNKSIQFEFQVTDLELDKGLFGCSISPRQSLIIVGHTNGFRYDMGIDPAVSTYTFSLNSEKHTIFYDGINHTFSDSVSGNLSWDGSLEPFENTAQTLAIFWDKLSRDNSNTRISKLKVYSFKVWNNEALILDLIPVRKGGVGYMYDKISGQLLGNSGTGNFILGPDIPKVNSIKNKYVQNGLLCHFDALNNVGYGLNNQSSTSWKDLTNNGHDVQLTQYAQFQNNALVKTSNTGLMAKGNSVIPVSTQYYDTKREVEIVLSLPQDYVYGEDEAMWFLFSGGGTVPQTLEANKSYNVFDTVVAFQFAQQYNRAQTCLYAPYTYMYNLTDKRIDQGFHVFQLPSYEKPYVDGVQQNGEMTYNQYSSSLDPSYRSYLTIGGALNSQSSSPILPCSANLKIHAIRVYDRHLTAEERLHNRNLDIQRFGN